MVIVFFMHFFFYICVHVFMLSYVSRILQKVSCTHDTPHMGCTRVSLFVVWNLAAAHLLHWKEKKFIVYREEMFSSFRGGGWKLGVGGAYKWRYWIKWSFSTSLMNTFALQSPVTMHNSPLFSRNHNEPLESWEMCWYTCGLCLSQCVCVCVFVFAD